MTIWKTEYLRYRYFFGTIFSIELLLDILRFLKMLPVVDGVDTVYSFWQMLSWIAIVALTIYDFFNFFSLSRDRLLHLLPVSKSKILMMKAVVFGTYMMAYFTLGLVRYLIILPNENTESKPEVATIYFISKLIAVIAFLALINLTLLIVKNINNKVIGAVIMAVVLGVVISTHAYGLYQIVDINYHVDWTIGIVDGAIGINHYANILPIVFTPVDKPFTLVENNFYLISVVINALESIVALILSVMLFKFRKFNYVES